MAASLSKNKHKMEEASTSNIPAKFVVPKELLRINNYRIWRADMRRNLEWHSLWGYLDTHDVNRRIELCKDREALAAIKMSCSADMLPHIIYADYAREAWDWLAETGSWTVIERENYNEMVSTAATARANLADIPEVDKVLTRRNYWKWRIYMQNALLSKYLWTAVDGSQTNESRSYKTKNHNALVIIRMSSGEEMFDYIDEEDNAKDAWCKLEFELGAATSNLVGNKIKVNHELLMVAVDAEFLLQTSSNYENWVFCMRNYLIVQDLWGFLEEYAISDCVKDEKALDIIKASCAPVMRAHILYVGSARHAWKVLQTIASKESIHTHSVCCEMVNEAARNRADLLGRSEADKVLTRSNYPMWEEYVTMLLRTLFLYDAVLPLDPESHLRILTDYKIKNACCLRIIKEACGREMMPYIFRSKRPEHALRNLRTACHMDPKDEYLKYSRLLYAVQNNGFQEKIEDRHGLVWRGVHKFIRDFPESLEAEITEDGLTTLHVAIQLGRVDFVRELLKLMTAPQLELKTRQGNTAIGVAARGNNMKILKMLVKRNPDFLLIEDGLHAIAIAATNGNERIMRYLYPLISKSKETWGAPIIASLLTSAARLDAFDIVRDLLTQAGLYTLVRDYDGTTLLSVLVEKPSAFPSGNQFGLLGGWIYRLAGSKTLRSVLKALKIIVPGVKLVFDSHEKHDDTFVILQHICPLILDLYPNQLKDLSIDDAVHQSTIHGIIEVFQILINTNPFLGNFKDENGRGLFQISIINRQDSIFQYMCQMGQRNQNMALLDYYGNNALHCAAFWDPSSQLVHGPALQMQREIQWFQEVERVVPPRYKEMRNKDNLTPKALFSREHKDLVKEAEKWMKEMANACIIVTALIATVMFAAPFTLPGGTDQNTGVSLTLQSRAFKVFIVSDVTSLFASCTSLLMFFSILTARYAERDFLTSLPRRLILGLFTLFFSMATMMVTFTATIIIVLRAEAQSRGFIWVSILACIPVLIFALLQFRLFGNLVISTYGRGVFRSKRVVVAPLISIGYG